MYDFQYVCRVQRKKDWWCLETLMSEKLTDLIEISDVILKCSLSELMNSVTFFSLFFSILLTPIPSSMHLPQNFGNLLVF